MVDHLLVFCGDGQIKDFVGGYTEYRTFIKDYEAEQRRQARAGAGKIPAQAGTRSGGSPAGKKRLSYKEQREFDALEAELEQLNAEKETLEALLSRPDAPYDQIRTASERYEALKAEIDTKETRWLELSL